MQRKKEMEEVNSNSEDLDFNWIPNLENSEEVEENFNYRMIAFHWLYEMSNSLDSDIFSDGYRRNIRRGRNLNTKGPHRDIQIDEINKQKKDFRDSYSRFLEFSLIEITNWNPVLNLKDYGNNNIELPFESIKDQILLGNAFALFFFSDSYKIFSNSAIPDRIKLSSISDIEQFVYQGSKAYISLLGYNLEGESANCPADPAHLKDMFRIVLLFKICFEDFIDALQKHYYPNQPSP